MASNWSKSYLENKSGRTSITQPESDDLLLLRRMNDRGNMSGASTPTASTSSSQAHPARVRLNSLFPMPSRGSSFYDGPTVFGGVSARRGGRFSASNPYLVSQRGVPVATRVRVNESNRITSPSDGLSASSRRFLEKLDKEGSSLDQTSKRLPSYSQRVRSSIFSINPSLSTSSMATQGRPIGPPKSSILTPCKALIDTRVKPIKWEIKAGRPITEEDQLDSRNKQNTREIKFGEYNVSDDRVISEGGGKMKLGLGRIMSERTSRKHDMRDESVPSLPPPSIPLSLPTGSKLPLFKFASKPTSTATSNVMPTTTITRVYDNEDNDNQLDNEFKFTQPILITRTSHTLKRGQDNCITRIKSPNSTKDTTSKDELKTISASWNKSSHEASSPLSVDKFVSSNNQTVKSNPLSEMKQEQLSPTQMIVNSVPNMNESQSVSVKPTSGSVMDVLRKRKENESEEDANLINDKKKRKADAEENSQLSITNASNISLSKLTRDNNNGYINYSSNDLKVISPNLVRPSSPPKILNSWNSKPSIGSPLSTPQLPNTSNLPLSSWSASDFKKPANSWSCPSCYADNPLTQATCLCCTEARPAAFNPVANSSPTKPTTLTAFNNSNELQTSNKKTNSGKWKCDMCGHENEECDGQCRGDDCEQIRIRPASNISSQGLAQSYSGFPFDLNSSSPKPFKFGFSNQVKEKESPTNINSNVGSIFGLTTTQSVTPSITNFTPNNNISNTATFTFGIKNNQKIETPKSDLNSESQTKETPPITSGFKATFGVPIVTTLGSKSPTNSDLTFEAPKTESTQKQTNMFSIPLTSSNTTSSTFPIAATNHSPSQTQSQTSSQDSGVSSTPASNSSLSSSQTTLKSTLSSSVIGNNIFGVPKEENKSNNQLLTNKSSSLFQFGNTNMTSTSAPSSNFKMPTPITTPATTSNNLTLTGDTTKSQTGFGSFGTSFKSLSNEGVNVTFGNMNDDKSKTLPDASQQQSKGLFSSFPAPTTTSSSAFSLDKFKMPTNSTSGSDTFKFGQDNNATSKVPITTFNALSESVKSSNDSFKNIPSSNFSFGVPLTSTTSSSSTTTGGFSFSSTPLSSNTNKIPPTYSESLAATSSANSINVFGQQGVASGQPASFNAFSNSQPTFSAGTNPSFGSMASPFAFPSLNNNSSSNTASQATSQFGSNFTNFNPQMNSNSTPILFDATFQPQQPTLNAINLQPPTHFNFGNQQNASQQLQSTPGLFQFQASTDNQANTNQFQNRVIKQAKRRFPKK